MQQLFSLLGTPEVIGLILGFLAVVLLSVIAARLSRVIDLLDEVAEIITSEAKQPEPEFRQPEQA